MWENTTAPLADEQVPKLLQGPILGRVLFLSPPWCYVVVAQLAVPQLPYGCPVGHLTQSQLFTASFVGKHSAYH